MRETHDKSDKNTVHTISRGGITRFGERLSTLINGESYKSFAKKCDMSDKAIRDYVAGKTYPALDRIAHIANVTGSSFEWLATGYDVSENNVTTSTETKNGDNLLTEKQQKVWIEIFDRMTPDERENVLDNVFRQGIGVLLGGMQQPSITTNKDIFDDLSADDLLIARMYSNLTPEQRKSFLESFTNGEHNQANRDIGDKTKAS